VFQFVSKIVVTVSSLGPSAAFNVSLDETFDSHLVCSNLEVIKTSSVGDVVCTPPSGVTSFQCATPLMPALSAFSVSIDCIAPASIVGVTDIPAVATALVKALSFQQDTDNDQADSNFFLRIVAELAVSLSGPPSPLIAGELSSDGQLLQKQYELNVCNLGPSTARNVTLTWTIPSQYTIIGSIITDLVCSLSGRVYTCIGLEIAAATEGMQGSCTRLSVLAVIESDAVGGAGATTIFSGDASSSTGEEDPLNYAELSIDIVSRADLRITKSGTQLIAAGDPRGGFYLMKIVNSGPSMAFNVRMMDFDVPKDFFIHECNIFINGEGNALPSGIGCTVYNPHNFSCSVGNLAPISSDTQVNILCNYSVPASSPVTVSGPVAFPSANNRTNIAFVVLDGADPTPSNNNDPHFVDVYAWSDVRITKDCLREPAFLLSGSLQEMEYVLSVWNGGVSDALNVNVIDMIPAELALTSVSVVVSEINTSSPVVCLPISIVNSVINCSVSRLRPTFGPAFELRVTVRAAPGATSEVLVENIANVSTTSNESPADSNGNPLPPLDNNFARCSTRIKPVTTAAIMTTSQETGLCLVVRSRCDNFAPRLDQDGLYCQPFTNGSDFSFRFSCSTVSLNSLDVFACGVNCSASCLLDTVTKSALELNRFDGQLGGLGQCFALPGMSNPGQISCSLCPVTRTTLGTSTLPRTTTATTTTLSTSFPATTTSPSQFCLNLTSPCVGGNVYNYDDGSQYCLQQDGPFGAPKVSLSLACSLDGMSITTSTCTSSSCSSGCVYNPVWAFIFGLDFVNASEPGQCVSDSISPVPRIPSPARFECTRGPCSSRSTVISTSTESTLLVTSATETTSSSQVTLESLSTTATSTSGALTSSSLDSTGRTTTTLTEVSPTFPLTTLPLSSPGATTTDALPTVTTLSSATVATEISLTFRLTTLPEATTLEVSPTTATLTTPAFDLSTAGPTTDTTKDSASTTLPGTSHPVCSLWPGPSICPLMYNVSCFSLNFFFDDIANGYGSQGCLCPAAATRTPCLKPPVVPAPPCEPPSIPLRCLTFNLRFAYLLAAADPTYG
jgi:uncharacterized repeat protein (TIGR01451 family)